MVVRIHSQIVDAFVALVYCYQAKGSAAAGGVGVVVMAGNLRAVVAQPFGDCKVAVEAVLA